MKTRLSLLALVAAAVLGCNANRPATVNAPPPPTKQDDASVIPGLFAVDVHGNLTNKGFSLERRIGSEQSEWTCRQSTAEYEYSVTAFGQTTKLTSIQATSISFSDEETAIRVAKPFLAYIATLPYDGSQPENAKQWVETNVGTNAITTFGPVQMELSSGGRANILRISPAE